jgi:hypothetical protein
MQRRLLSFALFGLIAYQSCGYFMAFVVRLELHHAAMHERLESDEGAENLERIQYCIDDHASMGFHWVNDEEFWLNGALYDLQSSSVSNEGEVTLIAFRDEAEFRQLAGLKMLWEGQEEGQDDVQPGLQFVQYRIPDFLHPFFTPNGTPSSPESTLGWNPEWINNTSPPPQLT